MLQRTLLSTLLTSGCVVCLLLVQDASSHHAQTSNGCAAHPAGANEDQQPAAVRLALDRIQALLDRQPPIPFAELAREAHLLAGLNDASSLATAGDPRRAARHMQLRDASFQLAVAAEQGDEHRCAILLGELTSALSNTRLEQQ
jgi:hypothetical protein